MIRTENISKSFGNLEVLKGINLHIKEREIVSIVGASGAGKTTLLQILKLEALKIAKAKRLFRKS